MSETNEGQSLLLQMQVKHFRCCSVSQPQRVKGDWCRKWSQNFPLFDAL